MCFGHVERKGGDDWVKSYTVMEVESKRPRGRARKMWMKTLSNDMRCALSTPADTKDTSLWREMIHGAKWPTQLNLDYYAIGVFTCGNAVKLTCVCIENISYYCWLQTAASRVGVLTERSCPRLGTATELESFIDTQPGRDMAFGRL
jgi:hypothetical protein